MSTDAYFRRPTFLTSALGAHVRLRFGEALRPLGLQPQHYGLLHRVAGADGPTQQALATVTGVRRNAMVALLDDLEAAGLVERRRHPLDRRANSVHITAAGRARLQEADGLASSLDERLLAPLDEDERDRFLELLDRVAAGAGLQEGVHPDLGDTTRTGG